MSVRTASSGASREGRSLQSALFPRRAVDPAGATVACAAATGVLHGAIGTAEVQQLEYNLLFRWFIGLSTDDPV
jgi:hypothetical protein